MSQRVQVVSYSEIESFRQCPFKHQLGYVERWQKPPTATGALAKGTLWHAVLEAHYRVLQRLQDDDTVIAAHRLEQAGQAARAVLSAAFDSGSDPDVVALISWMYEGYVEFYGVDADWHILGVESNIVVPLFELDGRKTRFRLKTKLDLVVRSRATGKLILVDHKSHKNLPGDEKILELSEQFPLYEISLRRVGKPVFASVYSATRAYQFKTKDQPLSERHTRKWMGRTPQELDNIAHDVLMTVKTMYSTANRGERRPDPERCRWRCDFTDACMLGRSTNDSRTRTFLQDTGWAQEFRRH